MRSLRSPASPPLTTLPHGQVLFSGACHSSDTQRTTVRSAAVPDQRFTRIVSAHRANGEVTPSPWSTSGSAGNAGHGSAGTGLPSGRPARACGGADSFDDVVDKGPPRMLDTRPWTPTSGENFPYC